MKVLILEDSVERYSQFQNQLEGHLCFVHDAHSAIGALQKNEWDVVFLDHDLGEGNGTGYDVACWLEEHEEHMPIVVVHSSNPVGAKRILLTLIPSAYYMPNAWEDDGLKARLEALLRN